jgi:hypothetical protein
LNLLFFGLGCSLLTEGSIVDNFYETFLIIIEGPRSFMYATEYSYFSNYHLLIVFDATYIKGLIINTQLFWNSIFLITGYKKYSFHSFIILRNYFNIFQYMIIFLLHHSQLLQHTHTQHFKFKTSVIWMLSCCKHVIFMYILYDAW